MFLKVDRCLYAAPDYLVQHVGNVDAKALIMSWSRSIIDPKIWRPPEIDGYNHPKRNVIPLLVSVRPTSSEQGGRWLEVTGAGFQGQ
jgi:hypothetical protein